MAEDAADAGADEGDLLGAVDRAVVDEELFGDAAFVERQLHFPFTDN